jgi:hypothetical protein
MLPLTSALAQAQLGVARIFACAKATPCAVASPKCVSDDWRLTGVRESWTVATGGHDFRPEYVSRLPLAKAYGELRIYRLDRR